MNTSEFLYDVLIFLLAAVVVVPVFQRLRTSPVLGYLAAGIIVGPHGLAIIRDSESAHALAEFGVVFLLFMIGLELSMKRLRSLSRYVFGLGALQVAITGILIAGVAWSVGVSTEAAIIIGCGLALSSTAFVIQLLIERGERTSTFGNISFAVLLFQDLAIVPFLLLVTLLGEGEGTFITAMGLAILEAAVALILVVGIGRLIMRPVYRFIAETGSSELFVATTLLIILGTGWLLSFAGISIVLGAFLAGLLLSETEYKHQVEADIRPFRGILLGLFFMTVGMTIDLNLILNEIEKIALLVIGLLLGKSIITTVLCRIFRLPLGISVRTGLILSQGGEFGFILFIAASTLGLLPADTAQILVAGITLTMVATPLMAYMGGRFSAYLEGQKKTSVAGVDQIIEDLHDHVLIVGFGRVGQTVAKILSAGGVPFIALDMDAARIQACRAKSLPVYFGDASRGEILKVMGANQMKCAVITVDQLTTADRVVAALHEFFPDLPIFVRARGLLHVRRLESEGATQAVPEALEASLQLGAITLNSMGASSDEISEIIQELRKDDYANLSDTIHG